MRARQFKQDPVSADPNQVTNSYVREALEKQAARRGPKEPPRALPITPTLPKMPKLYRRRRAK